jgi:hypothetical protein
MEREGVDAQAAFHALLRLSLSQGVPLREQALSIMRSALRPELASGSGQR